MAQAQSTPWGEVILKGLGVVVFPRTAVTNYHKPGGLRQIRSLVVPEAGSPKLKCQRARLPLRALGENPFWPLPAPGGSWHSLACGSITPISASVFMWLSALYLFHISLFLLQGHLSLDLGPILNPGRSHLEILNSVIWTKTLFPNKVTFIGSRH